MSFMISSWWGFILFLFNRLVPLVGISIGEGQVHFFLIIFLQQA